MPRRDDLESVLILGSGPIVIGQACEFDYSGTQAVRALREEGYRVILVNSNPATIMTDPDLADRTYIEPLTPEWVERVIERERPPRCCRPWGDRPRSTSRWTSTNAACSSAYGVELIGANARSIAMAENREEFSAAMTRIGLDVAHGGFAKSLDDGYQIVEATGYPAIVRAELHPRWDGGGIAYNVEELEGAGTQGHRRVAHPRGADRPVSDRLEGVRARGRARRGRQRDHRLLDREFRCDGRSHRRFHHGGAGADARRRRVPAHA